MAAMLLSLICSLTAFVFAFWLLEVNSRLFFSPDDPGSEDSGSGEPEVRAGMLKGAVGFFCWKNVPELAASLAGGIVFGIYLHLRVQSVTGWLRLFPVFFVLIASAIVDQRTKKIPNILPLILLVSWAFNVLINFFLEKDGAISFLLSGLLASAGIFIFFMICRGIAKKGIGFGDIKLISALGLTAGVSGTISILFFSELTALIYALYGLLSRKLSFKDGISFAPFFFLGFLITLILGTL